MNFLQKTLEELSQKIAMQFDAKVAEAIAKMGLPELTQGTAHLYRCHVFENGWQQLIYLPTGLEVCRWRHNSPSMPVQNHDGEYTVNSGIEFIAPTASGPA